MDLLNTISPGALKLVFEMNGWILHQPFVHNDVAYIKPDFYPDKFIIASCDGAYIYASGYTRLNYRGQTWDSVNDIIDSHSHSSLEDFSDWVFEVEKEWVISKNDTDFIFSFTTLDKLPKAKKLRC